jgi:hypothetical protein
MSRASASAMNIQERLSAFDSWLTGRIEEAHATRKDLAFRYLSPEESAEAPWEYSLLEPGARSPQGDGWSIYRLNGVWPEGSAEYEPEGSASGQGRRSLLDAVADLVFGRSRR